MNVEKSYTHLNCNLPETEIFTPSFVQNDILSSHYEEIFTRSKLDHNSPLEFAIENSGTSFIDLRNSYLHIVVQILKTDGSALQDDDNVAFINYPIGSLFSQVEVSLGNKIISSSSGLYPYKCIFETLLNYGIDAVKSQLQNGLFVKDTSGHMNETDCDSDNNYGLKTRGLFTKKSNQVELIGAIHSELFSQDRFIINGIPLKIVFTRNMSNFVLMSGTDNANYIVKINDASIFLRRCVLNPDKFEEIQKTIVKKNVLLPMTRNAMLSRTIGVGVGSHTWNNITTGKLPNKLIFAFVKNDSLMGSYKLNPFNFENFNIRKIGLYVDNVPLPTRALKLNFEKELYTEGYLTLFTGTNKLFQDSGLQIKRRDYSKGYSIFAFDISPSLCFGAHVERFRTGSVRLELEFAKSITSSVSIIAYIQYDSLLQINAFREVVTDYI